MTAKPSIILSAFADEAANSKTAVEQLSALDFHAKGEPDCVVRVNDTHGGLVLYRPGNTEPTVLYDGRV